MFQKISAQSTRTDRHHHVVERAARCFLQSFQIVERRRTHGESTVRSDGSIPGRGRSRSEGHRDDALVFWAFGGIAVDERFNKCTCLCGGAANTCDADGGGQRLHHAELQSGVLDRVQCEIGDSPSEQVKVAGNGFALPWGAFARWWGVGR